jgi:beta-glucosidase-like glycosyl hydrolase
MRFLHLIPAISHFYIAAQALGATFNATLWKKIGAVISTEVRSEKMASFV